MITQRGLTILTIASLAAAITTALALADGYGRPAALLAAGTAAGATLGLLPRLIDDHSNPATADRSEDTHCHKPRKNQNDLDE